MVELRVTYNREVCVGSFDCAAADPRRFGRNATGDRAVLRGGTAEEPEVFVLTFETADTEPTVGAARACPVAAIVVEDLTSGRTLA